MKSIKSILYSIAGGLERLCGLEELSDARTTIVYFGLLQFVVAVIAGFSGVAAALSFNLEIGPAILVGVLWGAFILVLDINFVRNTPKLSLRALTTLAPRLALSLLIAILVSIPLEVAIFRGPIETGLAARNTRFAQEINSEVERVFPQVSQLRQRITERNADLEDVRLRTAGLQAEVISEVEGSSRTGIPGHGPAWREKQAAYESAQNDYEALKSETERLNTADRNAIAGFEAQMETQKSELNRTQAHANGLADKVRVLHDLESSDPAVGIFAWLIRITLICIELIPLALKLTWINPLYDEAAKDANRHDSEIMKQRALIRSKSLLQEMAIVSEARDEVLNHQIKSATERAKSTALNSLGTDDIAARLAGDANARATSNIPDSGIAWSATTVADLQSTVDKASGFIQRLDNIFDGNDYPSTRPINGDHN